MEVHELADNDDHLRVDGLAHGRLEDTNRILKLFNMLETEERKRDGFRP